jgi:hypothetical protein
MKLHLSTMKPFGQLVSNHFQTPENYHPVLIVNESDILKSINSFPCGSAPGIDSIRPQFLKDMVLFSAGEAGGRALAAIIRQQRRNSNFLWSLPLCASEERWGN